MEFVAFCVSFISTKLSNNYFSVFGQQNLDNEKLVFYIQHLNRLYKLCTLQSILLLRDKRNEGLPPKLIFKVARLFSGTAIENVPFSVKNIALKTKCCSNKIKLLPIPRKSQRWTGMVRVTISRISKVLPSATLKDEKENILTF